MTAPWSAGLQAVMEKETATITSSQVPLTLFRLVAMFRCCQAPGDCTKHTGHQRDRVDPAAIGIGTYRRGAAAREPMRRRYPLVVDGPPIGVVPAHEGASERVVRIMCAVVVVTAVASAGLLLWLAAGDGDGLQGLEARCVSRFEDGGGNTSICGRVSTGARSNAAWQLSLAVVCGVLALRARQPLVWLRVAVAISVALTILSFVFMRSWEFGLGQSLL